MRRKVMLVGVAALAAAGGGAAIAAATGSPNDERKAVIDDAAKQLGVTPAKLSSALKKALENRVDAAVAAGRLTKDQGEALKKRIESDDYPALGLGFGLGHRGGHLDAAAAYLGVSQDALRAQLEDGKTLADVAKATKGKSVDGLVAALVADEKEKLDAAVKAGRLTQAQADAILADATARTTDLVNGTFSTEPHWRFGGPGDGNGPLRTAPRRHRTTI